jgi:uncharacterized protein YeaO (DUF488 family)
MEIKLKRAYEPPAETDGARILVERLWPRGIKKEDAALALWAKEIAPSPELRKWYNHEPDRWPEFQQRYRAELAGNAEAVAALRARCGEGPVTFVFAARDEERNSAVLLKRYLEETS